MGLLNDINCAPVGRGNTGYGSCVVAPGMVTGEIRIPKGTEIPFTDLTALKTAITAGINNNTTTLRYYPVVGLIPQADNTEDVSIITYNDGTKQIGTEGKYDYTFILPLGGKFCLTHRLRKHNALSEDILLIIDNKYLWGTEGSTPTMIKGISPSFAYAQPVRFQQEAGTPTQYMYRVSFEPTQVNDRPQIVTFTDGFLASLQGLQDVALSKVSRAANVLTVKAKTACGTVDLYDAFSVQLAAVAAWRASTPAGADLTITSVTAVPNTKSFAITVSTSDPDYVAGADIIVQLAGPTDLKALNVVGYESDALTVTV